MEHKIRSALADKNYPLAQTLADNWLSQEPYPAVAHYLAAWARDAQGLEAEALVHCEKSFELGLSGENLRGALLGAGSTYRNLGNLTRSEEILRRGIQDYGETSEFSAFLALTLYSAARSKEAVSILLQLLADSTANIHIKRYDGALSYYAANPDRN
jgi:tetratricopeptide (TPR) repeat protein